MVAYVSIEDGIFSFSLALALEPTDMLSGSWCHANLELNITIARKCPPFPDSVSPARQRWFPV